METLQKPNKAYNSPQPERSSNLSPVTSVLVMLRPPPLNPKPPTEVPQVHVRICLLVPLPRRHLL